LGLIATAAAVSEGMVCVRVKATAAVPNKTARKITTYEESNAFIFIMRQGFD
jgi:hypothetical protein